MLPLGTSSTRICSWYTLQQHLVAGSRPLCKCRLAASSGLQLDELCLHPAGAQMTGYISTPRFGLTSQTVASGRTRTYEYGVPGRLLCTRDDQGRLLTSQQYYYARP
jgi:hypothetical protein